MCGDNIVALFDRPEGRLSGASAMGSEVTLASLSGTAVESRFHAWLGLSGQRYIVSVFPVDPMAADLGLPGFEGCVLIPVVRHGARRVPLAARQIERETDRRAALASLKGVAIAEWHVHLLAGARADRVAAAADLRARDEEEIVAIRA